LKGGLSLCTAFSFSCKPLAKGFFVEAIKANMLFVLFETVLATDVEPSVNDELPAISLFWLLAAL
jgi:hypothetical protein